MEMPCLSCDFLLQLRLDVQALRSCPTLIHPDSAATQKKIPFYLCETQDEFWFHILLLLFNLCVDPELFGPDFSKNLKELWKYIPLRLLAIQFFFLLNHVITGTNQRISGFLFVIDCMWEQVSEHL